MIFLAFIKEQLQAGEIEFKICIVLFLFIIFVSYTLIGRNFHTTHLSPYLMLFGIFLSFFTYYYSTLNFRFNKISKRFTLSILIIIFFSLIYIGNFFSYFFLFDISEINFKLIFHLNDIFAVVSSANANIEKTGLYNSMIEYNKNNEYMLMNICSFKDKIDLFMAGMPNYHCMSYTRLIFGSGIIFLFFV